MKPRLSASNSVLNSRPGSATARRLSCVLRAEAHGETWPGMIERSAFHILFSPPRPPPLPVRPPARRSTLAPLRAAVELCRNGSMLMRTVPQRRGASDSLRCLTCTYYSLAPGAHPVPSARWHCNSQGSVEKKKKLNFGR